MSRESFPTGAEGGGVGENFVPSDSVNPRPIKKAAILGHSYVSRFFIDRPVYHPWFRLLKFSAPGAKVGDIRERPVWQEFLLYKPELTFLVLGGNDLCEETQPLSLAREIVDLSREIEESTGGRCVIVGIESRTSPRGLTPARYNKIKNSVNRGIRRLPFGSTRYVPMEMSKDELWDGVHLNPTASQDLFHRLVHHARRHFEAADPPVALE